jgi:hypothetical protein
MELDVARLLIRSVHIPERPFDGASQLLNRRYSLELDRPH